ncbi:hypothetical protein PAAG_11393 [Paracoccidioides lutzii Pb01]|uniref:Uncharacterized protein n=1 Tax=Paracoccidioides lutzii (strain ATCC MYA-826 / Pb01) TaxID=502779 RepID=A0A0A2V6T0_PARBA|nr:hypothetical protein PAAG_11393 [Paracoccidioides lutzii Pb01]KGQ01820.1 hypothetical protein PAAG_11393 [Paracoccidioides lutzii Pb01]
MFLKENTPKRARKMERNYEASDPKSLNLDDMRGSDDMVEWLELLGHSAHTSTSSTTIKIVTEHKNRLET